MKQLIIDGRMRNIEKEKCRNLGYELIELEQEANVYPEISSHVDIFVCKVGDTIIVEPSKYRQIKEICKKVQKGSTYLQERYPYDIRYNVAIIGKKAFHKFEYTDEKIKNELAKQGYELINTEQGYTKCSIAVIDDNSAIVTDKGLYKILQKHGVDVLFLDYEPDIKLWDNGKYSKRNGFIGGAITRLENSIIVFGDLKKIDKDNAIKNFITERNLNIVDFLNYDVIDYGGTIEINLQ